MPDGYFMFHGSLINVEQLVSQLKRSESARSLIEARMTDLQRELTTLNEKSNKQNNNIKDLSDDLKLYKDRLRTADDKLKKVTVSRLKEKNKI